MSGSVEESAEMSRSNLVWGALGATVLLAMSAVACSGGDSAEALGNTGGSTSDWPEETGGTGGSTGGYSGATQSTCPAFPARTSWSLSMYSFSVPGYGAWPDLLAVDPTSVTVGAGQNAADDGIGCDWEASSPLYPDEGTISCSGVAKVTGVNAEASQFEATFADGSVATFRVAGAVVPASGEMNLNLGEARIGTQIGVETTSSTSAREVGSNKLLWSIGEVASPEGAAELLGAPVEREQGCTSEYYDSCHGQATQQVFDLVVETTPEQRIVAGETSVITTADGAYDVDWYDETVEIGPPTVTAPTLAPGKIGTSSACSCVRSER